MRISFSQLSSRGYEVHSHDDGIDITPATDDGGRMARKVSNAIDGHGLTISQMERITVNTLNEVDWELISTAIKDSQ